MNPARKATIVVTGMVLALVILMAIGISLTSEVEAEQGTAEPMGEQLWDMRPLDLVILSVMLFAGVLGVLALVGGEFKWS